MKQFIIIISAVLFFINADGQKAMSNHTDVRVPPARPVRPIHANNIGSRKIPVIRIDHDNAEELTISNAVIINEPSAGNLLLNVTDNGSYRIFKGDFSIDVFYKLKKELSINKNKIADVKVLMSSDSVELDGKTFVCGVDNMDENLKRFSGENNDEMGYYLNVPENQDEWFVRNTSEEGYYKIISSDQDYLTVKFTNKLTAKEETKNIEGLMIVDPYTGTILAKNIRVNRTGTLSIKGKKFSYENHSTLKMGLQ